MKNSNLTALAFAVTVALTPSAFAADQATAPVPTPQATAATPAAPAPLVIPDPVANIGGKPYSKADYEKFVAFLTAQGQPAPDSKEQVEMILTNIALQEYFTHKAKAEKLDQLPAFQDQVKFISQNLLAASYVKKYADELKISDDEIQESYKKEVANLGKTEFNASHILVDSEDKAKDIIKKINDKKITFEEAAKTESQDGSGKDGGTLGWFAPNMMVPEFSAAVANLKKGEITATPVKTQFGFHIIRLDDLRDTTPPDLKTVKPQIEAALKDKKIKALIEKAKTETKVELLIK